MEATRVQEQEKVVSLLEQAIERYENELGGFKHLKMEHLQKIIDVHKATATAYEERYEALQKDLAASKEITAKAILEQEAAQQVCDLIEARIGSMTG